MPGFDGTGPRGMGPMTGRGVLVHVTLQVPLDGSVAVLAEVEASAEAGGLW